MKNIFSFLTILCLFLFNSCKSNSGSPTDSGGIGGIGGGGGGVTFAITQGQGAQGIIFYATPSTAVTVDSVHVSVGTSSGTLTGSNTVLQAKFEIQEFPSAAAGQAWTFVFMGKLGSATGTAYTATSNYTVQ